jgi:hypothetical protein
MDEALKYLLHLDRKVIMPSEAYCVSITKDEMRLARHHKAFPRD